MNVKLDENLPVSIAAIFANAGHDADTVVDEGLGGSDDPAVSRAAREAGRLLITLDRGFGDIERYPPGSHGGILVVRLDDQSAPAVQALFTALVAEVDLDTLAASVAVYYNGTMRVRRPGD